MRKGNETKLPVKLSVPAEFVIILSIQNFTLLLGPSLIPSGLRNAKEAMGLYLEDLEVYPNVTEKFDDIKLKKNQIISYVSVNMHEYKKKYSSASVKKTLSIPAWLNTMAEEHKINFSQVLQEALKEKLAIEE